ncbi:MAG: Type 1 glutamine amidotransferase-like domain-containing protein [Bacteroidales bacterium]|nr:Type 1 glutamine amidotransferase-like domain-containing protein [Bacteroidales bacterium]
MTLFLTSSHTIGWAGPLNPANDFAKNLSASLSEPIRCAMVSSYPDDEEITDRMAWEVRECFEDAGLAFDHFEVIDRRTQPEAQRIVAEANFLILCGGHVPTENAFFRDISLRELLQDWQGTVMGISAGSMNSAERVYSPPELEGEATDPTYSDHFQGLGLTDINILPHFQQLRRAKVDGKRLVHGIVAADSMEHPVYCLPDGSYFIIRDGETYLYGEAYRMQRGTLRRVCRNGERRRLSPTGRLMPLP